MKENIRFVEIDDNFYNKDGFVLETWLDDELFCEVTTMGEIIFSYYPGQNISRLSSYSIILLIVEEAIKRFPELETLNADFHGLYQAVGSYQIVEGKDAEETTHVQITVDDKRFANLYESGELLIFFPGNREFTTLFDGKAKLWWYFVNCMQFQNMIEKAVKILEES